MVEVTLDFEDEEQFERELRGVFEVIAMADEDDLEDGDYATVMLNTAQQAQIAYEYKVLGYFFNGDRLVDLSSPD